MYTTFDFDLTPTYFILVYHYFDSLLQTVTWRIYKICNNSKSLLITSNYVRLLRVLFPWFFRAFPSWRASALITKMISKIKTWIFISMIWNCNTMENALIYTEKVKSPQNRLQRECFIVLYVFTTNSSLFEQFSYFLGISLKKIRFSNINCSASTNFVHGQVCQHHIANAKGVLSLFYYLNQESKREPRSHNILNDRISYLTPRKKQNEANV